MLKVFCPRGGMTGRPQNQSFPQIRKCKSITFFFRSLQRWASSIARSLFYCLGHLRFTMAPVANPKTFCLDIKKTNEVLACIARELLGG